jgi:large subunit ribosomal protein L3
VGLQGISGYKAGMIQVIMRDDRKSSLTSGQEIAVPATVIETPPIFICAIRLYRRMPGGLTVASETWASDLPKELSRKLTLPKERDPSKSLEKAESLVKEGKIADVRVLACTQPWKSNMTKKKPDLIEIRVGGGSSQERWQYSKNLLGKEVRASDVFKEGEFVDVLAITKGKGFQGPVKRWGIKKLPRKTRGGVRQVGSIGPWSPARIMWTVPAAGQMGYHQRTEFNKRVLKIGASGGEVTPEGGFLRYGVIKSDYVVLFGSVPGSTKRLIHLRQPMRARVTPAGQPTITHISKASQQGA